MALPPGVWDASQWDGATWYQPAPPPGGTGWGEDWRFWYQVGPAVVHELTGLVVEAQWSTSSYTAGDGTFRGDLQPGSCTIRLWDPERLLDGVDPLGAVWAAYGPTGAAWCWFYDAVTRGLYTPGDPNQADCVFQGLEWPARLTSPNPYIGRNAERIDARLAGIVSAMNGQPGYKLPAVTADIAGQSQQMGHWQIDSSTGYPVGFLQATRDAAPFGVAWLEPVAGAALGAAGSLALRYRRWEAANMRPLDPAQIVAGPPVSSPVEQIITEAVWTAIDQSTGAAGSNYTFSSDSLADRTKYGYVQLGPMRAHDTITSGSAGFAAIQSTSWQLLTDRGLPVPAGYLSGVSCQSGPRWTPDGRPSTAAWDPAAHLWRPVDVADYVEPQSGQHRYYHVASSSHRLTATAWATDHVLDRYTAATALPP